MMRVYSQEFFGKVLGLGIFFCSKMGKAYLQIWLLLPQTRRAASALCRPLTLTEKEHLNTSNALQKLNRESSLALTSVSISRSLIKISIVSKASSRQSVS